MLYYCYKSHNQSNDELFKVLVCSEANDRKLWPLKLRQTLKYKNHFNILVSVTHPLVFDGELSCGQYPICTTVPFWNQDMVSFETKLCLIMPYLHAPNFQLEHSFSCFVSLLRTRQDTESDYQARYKELSNENQSTSKGTSC